MTLLREPPVQTAGLVRSDDPGCGKDFDEYLRKFHFPAVTDARLLFKPVASWDFNDPYHPFDHHHKLGGFRRNAPLPRGGVVSPFYAYWEPFDRGTTKGGTGLCYALETVSLSEGQCAEWGMRWSSVLTETARRGCDNGWFDSLCLINWSEGRTLVILRSGAAGISSPWVTLVDTAHLEALMSTAERLVTRPL